MSFVRGQITEKQYAPTILWVVSWPGQYDHFSKETKISVLNAL